MIYKYLFPFEKISQSSQIIIYGAGDLGRDYYQQMIITGYCNVVAFIDKNADKYGQTKVPIFTPDKINSLKFDYVVVALRMEAAFNEIKRILILNGVSEEKIVAVFERKYEFSSLEVSNDVTDTRLSYDALDDKPSIAILVTGGFGDMVIQKRFIVELINISKLCSVDIFAIKSYEFLKNLYTDVQAVKNVLPDLGIRYQNNKNKYDLSITIEACHFIRVDNLKKDKFLNNLEFHSRIERLIEETRKENADILMPVHVTMMRRMYQELNCYSGFNYNGAFEIGDKKVNIPLDDAAKDLYENNLKGKQYFTINYGNGDCSDGSKVAKMWPKENWEQLVVKLKELYPDIEIVQLGEATAEHIKGCDMYILGESFSQILHILKNSTLHIDIEGGLVHIATQLGTKCVVLFGPTVLEYYGYEENINIKTGNCHNCWGLFSDVNKCAKELEKPSCMYAITPEMVTEEITKYMDRRWKSL